MRPEFHRAAAALLLLLASPAFAHSEFSAVKPFWSGVFHALLAPLTLAAVLGLVAAIGGRRDERLLWAICLGAVAAVFGALFPLPAAAWAVPAGVVVGGLCAVAGRTLPVALGAPLAIGLGYVAGLAAELDTPSLNGALGVATTIGYVGLLGLLVVWHLEARPRLAPAIRIGRRILGAWVSAIGMLLGALALRGLLRPPAL